MKFRLASRLLAALPLSAFVPTAMASDGTFLLGDSAPPAATAPTVPAAHRAVTPPTRPCPPVEGPGYMTPMGLTDKQADAALESAMFPESKTSAAAVAEDVAAAAASTGVIDGGVRLKALQGIAESRLSIEHFYREYRSMANEGKVNAATRDLYAKERIGPRLDSIYTTEVNWLGKEPDGQRRAGQVQARVKLAEIEYQAALNNAQLEADRLVILQWKYKHESKDRSYEPLTREAALKAVQESLKRSYESSPEYLEGERAKQLQPEPKKVETKGSQNLTDCPQGKEASVEVLRRGASSGTALFQGAINQAKQDEIDRPAREARERIERARAAGQEREAKARAAKNDATARAFEQQQAQRQAAAAARSDSASETAELVNGALSILGTVLEAKAARAGARAGASGSGPGASTSGCMTLQQCGLIPPSPPAAGR